MLSQYYFLIYCLHSYSPIISLELFTDIFISNPGSHIAFGFHASLGFLNLEHFPSLSLSFTTLTFDTAWVSLKFSHYWVLIMHFGQNIPE